MLLYERICAIASANLGPEYEFDQNFADEIKRDTNAMRLKLEEDLTHYKQSMIKESVRVRKIITFKFSLSTMNM